MTTPYNPQFPQQVTGQSYQVPMAQPVSGKTSTYPIPVAQIADNPYLQIDNTPQQKIYFAAGGVTLIAIGILLLVQSFKYQKMRMEEITIQPIGQGMTPLTKLFLSTYMGGIACTGAGMGLILIGVVDDSCND